MAYNLIRTVMAQAAARHGVAPRSISFTGAMQTLEAFQPLLEFGAAQDAASRFFAAAAASELTPPEPCG